MDKQKAVNRLIDMMEKLPNAEVRDMAYILIDIINEIPDQEPTVMEQFCKWKEFDRRPRNFICRAIFENGVNVFGSLSFAQAIKVMEEDGCSIRHESWPTEWALVPRWSGKGIKFFDGVSFSPEFTLITNMIGSGWIVLDK